MKSPFTMKQRAARIVCAWLGVPFDDQRLDLTSAEHPAFTRGFSQACLACSREMARIDANRGTSHKEKCVAYARYADQLHRAHQPVETEAAQ